MQPVVLRIKRKRSRSFSSWVASEPPTVALWPSMYLVVESTLMSAPSWNTGCSTGVRKVLSTARRTPCRRATAAIAGMSHSLSVGFPGVSMKINFRSEHGLQHRRQKSVVPRETNSVPASNGRNRRDVAQLERRISRRLNEDQLQIGTRVAAPASEKCCPPRDELRAGEQRPQSPGCRTA